MVVSESRIRDYLKSANFRDLFIRELGWDHYRERLHVDLPPDSYLLQGVAEKRGMAVFVAAPDEYGRIPEPAARRKIEKQAARSVHEHIIIYVDSAGTTQVWQWVKREAGKPDRAREYTLHAGQSGEPLIQNLQSITFTLDQEAELDLVEVTGKVRAAFDVDKVTKRFYDRFKTEHDRFLGFIQGMEEQGDREWYASLMLNRLMFVYFIQKKGFLDGDPDYLGNRLRLVQQRRGHGQFLSFYRHFLLRLFHEGLGQSQRSSELDTLLGTVPYLNGGLFDVHQLELGYPGIEIADEAFQQVFAFFDQYEWHLDTRPLRKDNEINPDVLGYIFEKYINQKQMGAYYTKEDITGYISKNTVIPFLFDEAKKRCAIAFEPAGSVWSLLRDNPDRYIYEPVRKGVDLELPAHIAGGIHDVSRRGDWNRPAAAECALPTETWREHVARRQRCYEVRQKLAGGQVN
ncbi:MAG: SAM-dependent methyltransferase, partial [Chloroflexi bacterium]